MSLIAKEDLPAGEKRVYAILKSLGAKTPEVGKREWTYENVSEQDLDKDFTEFLQKKKETKTRAAVRAKQTTNERKKKTTKEVKSEITNEEKNIPTNERKHDTTKEETEKPTKEEKQVLRKRASFDIDSELLKELKIFAITEEKNVYEIVENAIRTYLREREINKRTFERKN